MIDRRSWLLTGVCGTAAAIGASKEVPADEGAPPTDARSPSTVDWRFCLNTATISGAKLSLPKLIELTAGAGYDGIEVWIRDLVRHQEEQGSLSDIKKQIADAGLEAVNAIGFARWIVDDPEERKRGRDDLLRDMDLARQIGCPRIAAPPSGATRVHLDPMAMAERYRELIEIGARQGVAPRLEMWGSSQSLSRLGELAFVAIESGSQAARILPDVYHIYRGGSSLDGLAMIDGRAIEVFHLNDYPADPGRTELNDSHRIYPGDGIAPLGPALASLARNGFDGFLSLELFNREYWKQDPAEVARVGLDRMRRVARMALQGSR